MTNTELLAALGKLRGQVAQMTDAPWEAAFQDKSAISTSAPPGGLIGEFDCADDNVGIAALRNAADELIAAIVALACEVQERRQRPYGTCEQRHKWDTDAALAALAKKLEER